MRPKACCEASRDEERFAFVIGGRGWGGVAARRAVIGAGDGPTFVRRIDAKYSRNALEHFEATIRGLGPGKGPWHAPVDAKDVPVDNGGQREPIEDLVQFRSDR